MRLAAPAALTVAVLLGLNFAGIAAAQDQTPPPATGVEQAQPAPDNSDEVVTETGESTLADTADWQHGDTLFGELKYGPDFTHYEHVNPDAPKGGTLNQAATGSYDSFNPFVVRGRAAAGLTYFGGLLYDTLFEQSMDQASASYGLIAEAYHHPEDYSSATFRLNPKARWHDGKPITVEDVIWSLETLKRNYPLFTNYYQNVTSAEKTGEREVTFTFDVTGNRELPHIMGDLPVLPKHWWEGADANGNQRNIDEPTTEPPLGSGPYRIADFDMGKTVTWERVDDYWGADLPVRRGRYNFDRIRYTYFLDESAMWEAFKKGGIIDTRTENISRRWQTEYDFPAFDRGDVKKDAFPSESSEPFQGYFINLRRDKFKDIRVRKALTLLFDFESMNKTLFFDAYTRTDSFFEGGELQHQPGLPQGREKEILEEYRGRIDDAVIDTEFKLPVYDSPEARREHQREAKRLLNEAGYTQARDDRGFFTKLLASVGLGEQRPDVPDGTMIDAEGRPLEIEILGSGPTDERVGIPTMENFRRLGIVTNVRVVDTAQYKNRIDNFNFDISMLGTIQSLSPGNEQREYWSSRAAGQPGSRNYSGIESEVVDELVERIIAAHDRDELVALTRALDRILMHGYYAIPMWHNPETWMAWWKKLQFPPTQPLYTGIDTYSLWIDEGIEAATPVNQETE